MPQSMERDVFKSRTLRNALPSLRHTAEVLSLPGWREHGWTVSLPFDRRENLENGGALVTEMPLGWEPRARDFPRRNRLVSGLTLGTVVVEAAKRSGSLITARLALEQNREVFAVPGSPLDPRAEGGNALIQQGAHLITGAQDIIDILREADPSRTSLLEPDWLPEVDFFELAPPSDDERAILIGSLSVTPVAIDDVIKSTGIATGRVQTLLLELDLEGRIEWSSGQLVALRE